MERRLTTSNSWQGMAKEILDEKKTKDAAIKSLLRDAAAQFEPVLKNMEEIVTAINTWRKKENPNASQITIKKALSPYHQKPHEGKYTISMVDGKKTLAEIFVAANEKGLFRLSVSSWESEEKSAILERNLAPIAFAGTDVLPTYQPKIMETLIYGLVERGVLTQDALENAPRAEKLTFG